jgi:hypothetical protein
MQLDPLASLHDTASGRQRGISRRTTAGKVDTDSQQEGYGSESHFLDHLLGKTPVSSARQLFSNTDDPL